MPDAPQAAARTAATDATADRRARTTDDAASPAIDLSALAGGRAGPKTALAAAVRPAPREAPVTRPARPLDDMAAA